VQGVGFRFGTATAARRLGLTGSAINRADGSVEIEAYGDEPAIQQLLDWLRGPTTPGRVRRVEVEVLTDGSTTPPSFDVG
jgi:acylphosphatase